MVEEAEENYGGSNQRSKPEPTEQGGGESKRRRKARTQTWSNVVKGLNKEDKLETADSDKSGNGSETANSVKQFDSEEPNNLKAKRTKGKRKRCQHCHNKVVGKGHMSRQAEQEGRGIQNRTGRGARARHEARRSWSEEPEKHEKPQVELEGEC